MRNLRGWARTPVIAAVALAALALWNGTPVYAQGGGSADVANKKVTLNLENADIRYALQLLFKSAGVNFSLDQAVSGTVTVSLTDVPFRTALESILRSTQSTNPLTYRVEDGVYIISPKKEEVAENPTSTTEENTTNQPKYRFVKIPLNFADVFDIANAFGGDVIVSRFSYLTSGSGGYGGGYGNGFGGGFGGGLGGYGGGLGGFGGGFGGLGGYGGGLGGFGGGFGNFGGGFGNFGGGFGGGFRGGFGGGGFRGGF
ncbi:MAG: hypothetical protein ACP5VE_11855 [Chthonomonadales bacterium]